MGGIYFIMCSANNKIYIGSAKNLYNRWREHKAMLSRGIHFNKNLQRAWDKYGSDYFEYSIKESLGEYNKEFFFSRENYWIDLSRENGILLFNIARAEGGWGSDTFLRKEEICAKISSSLKIFNSALSKDERCAIYGKNKKGIPLSAEHKQKTSLAMKGKKKSDETKRKMSESQKNTVNPNRKLKMSEIGKRNIGRTPTNAIPITIDGVEYKSCQHASSILGIPYKQIVKIRKAKNEN